MTRSAFLGIERFFEIPGVEVPSITEAILLFWRL
jgi:hypothetical protein